uniref:DUF6824 domain-containing protein n=1 Tax=Corethron hystrix TaxID=216773 RepID=A0A7S1FRW5_9STRA|mmetsp:Transcript_2598/g.4961  ORF Transcript_2598/g.4961 Transcript_2598/m.4961 type:complete len:715 (+) Transcript_2598:259-2403(+)
MIRQTPDKSNIFLTPRRDFSPYSFESTNQDDTLRLQSKIACPCETENIVTPDQYIQFIGSNYCRNMQSSENAPHAFKYAHEKIASPHEHDVLSGRGSGISSHPGNEYLRRLVAEMKTTYLMNSSKGEKTRIGQSIVDHIRSRNPPGRFLARSADDAVFSDGNNLHGFWYEIGDQRARQKVNQCLREGAKKIKAKAKATKDGLISQTYSLDSSDCGADGDFDETELQLKRSSSSDTTITQSNRAKIPRPQQLQHERSNSYYSLTPTRVRPQSNHTTDEERSATFVGSVQRYGRAMGSRSTSDISISSGLPCDYAISDKRWHLPQNQSNISVGSDHVFCQNIMSQNQTLSSHFTPFHERRIHNNSALECTREYANWNAVTRCHLGPAGEYGRRHHNWQNPDRYPYDQFFSPSICDGNTKVMSDTFITPSASSRNSLKSNMSFNYARREKQGEVMHYTGNETQSKIVTPSPNTHAFSARALLHSNTSSIAHGTQIPNFNECPDERYGGQDFVSAEHVDQENFSISETNGALQALSKEFYTDESSSINNGTLNYSLDCSFLSEVSFIPDVEEYSCSDLTDDDKETPRNEMDVYNMFSQDTAFDKHLHMRSFKKKIERNSINNPSSERQPTKTKEVCTKNLKRRNSDSSCFSMKSISSSLSEITSGDHLHGNTEAGLSDTCFIMRHNLMANENDMSNFEICSDIDCSTSCQTVIFQNPN